MRAEAWHDVINTNLNSVFNVTQPLFSAMCEKVMAALSTSPP